MSAAMHTADNAHFSEKIFIEPDLGDLRTSTSKALPAPPKTPKRIMMKYRFSAIFSFVFAATSFALTIVVVLAGRDKGNPGGLYLLALNTSSIGQDLIKFEKATSTATAASATASPSSSPRSPSNPFPTNSSFNDLLGLLNPIANNLTDALNNGLDKLVDSVAEELVEKAGIADFYYLYLQTVCSGSIAKGTKGNADGIVVERCDSRSEAQHNIETLTSGIQSSIVIGPTNISIPLLAKLPSSLNSVNGGLSTGRKALFAFLIISLIGSALSALSALPAIVFPHSRLLVYFNILWACLATAFAFLGAVLATIGGTALPAVVGGIGEAIGVEVKQGSMVAWFTWLAWLFTCLPLVYWGAIWFVEVRESSFVKRARSEQEIGSWRGIGVECWRDLKGRNWKATAT